MSPKKLANSESPPNFTLLCLTGIRKVRKEDCAKPGRTYTTRKEEADKDSKLEGKKKKLREKSMEKETQEKR